MIYIYKAELIRVVDGDTVDLVIDLGFDTSRKERFRLYGVDAPEMNTKEGKEAKAWLEDAIRPPEPIYVQTIQLETKAKRDKYGRFLAVLYGFEPVLSSADGPKAVEFVLTQRGWSPSAKVLAI